MSAHGRPRGRLAPRPRSVPPHVLAERAAWDEYRRKTTPEQRRRISALLHGRDPEAGERQLRLTAVRELPLFAAVLGGGTCCHCGAKLDLYDVGGFEWTLGGRLMCMSPECHAADERFRAREGEAA
jgi:hypothetical protein